MARIVVWLGQSCNRRFRKKARTAEDAKLALRYRIMLNLDEGRSVRDTALALDVAESKVRRVGRRYLDFGEAGLVDHRTENGGDKRDEDYLGLLYEAVSGSPQDYGFPRPTWTRELLVALLRTKTGTSIHVSTMSRALRQIGARRGRPKPTLNCPWSEQAKNKRLRAFDKLIRRLPRNEVAVFEDEVDIHLNPKIGLDWMVCGQPKEVMTPGQNEKRYLAGAMEARSGEIIWVEGERKDSLLFVRLLWELCQRYPDAKRIHVILDNYSIHSTEQVQMSLQTPAGKRIVLHYLLPYCPDHNRIERIWQDLHANVTRNHKCVQIAEVMMQVRLHLRRRNRYRLRQYSNAA